MWIFLIEMRWCGRAAAQGFEPRLLNHALWFQPPSSVEVVSSVLIKIAVGCWIEGQRGALFHLQERERYQTRTSNRHSSPLDRQIALRNHPPDLCVFVLRHSGRAVWSSWRDLAACCLNLGTMCWRGSSSQPGGNEGSSSRAATEKPSGLPSPPASSSWSEKNNSLQGWPSL